MISQHWDRQWLAAVRQQAIAWASVDPDICHPMASPGHSKLIKTSHCVSVIVTGLLQYILAVYIYIYMICTWFWLPMMTSSNGNIFRITGPLCREFTSHRWIPSQRPVTWRFDVFFDLHLKNVWVNNRDTGDLRCHFTHHDVTVMFSYTWVPHRFMWFVHPYSSGLLHWHWDNMMIAPKPVQ